MKAALSMAMAVAMVALIGNTGCTGQLGSPAGEGGDEFEPGTFTYQSLLRRTQFKSNGQYLEDDVYSPGEATGSLDESQDVGPSPQVKLELRTRSTCTVGDLDFVITGMAVKISDLIVSLEVPNGPKLGSFKLNDETLVTVDQLQHAGVSNDIVKTMTLNVPPGMNKAGSQLTANLFVCRDENNSGVCADELVDQMQNIPANVNSQEDVTFKVVYFAPLKLTFDGGQSGTVSVQRTPESDLNFADRLMVKTLNNLPPDADQGALSANLAVGSKDTACPGNAQQQPQMPEVSPEDIANGIATGLDLLAKAFGLAMKITDAALKIYDAMPKQSPRGVGCFVRGTRIEMGDRPAVNVEKIGIGSTVTLVDGRRRRTLRAVAGPEKPEVIEFSTAGGHVLGVTRTHPMMTPNGLKMAKDLWVGQELMTSSWAPVRITKLRRYRYEGLVYNFAMPGVSLGDHLVVAEGLITGDLHFQEQLSSK
jgi:hypothetical protein